MTDPLHFLRPVAHTVMTRFFEAGIQGLSDAERSFLLVWVFGDEADEGGIEQFLVHLFGEFADETVAALRNVGAPRSARALDEAIGLFGLTGLPPALEKRNDALDALSPEKAGRLEELTQEYFHSGEEYDEILLEFVRAHPALLDRPPDN